MEKKSEFKKRIVICVNDEHSSKASSPIEVTEEGIVICLNDEHPIKAHFLIAVTEEGFVICVNDEHPGKAYSPIEVIEEGIVICINLVQFLKHSSSISISFSFIKRLKISSLLLFAAFINGEKS